MELNDKIGLVDRETFQRMLGIKPHENLPDFLLVEYFRVKKLLDKVDGTVGAFGLATIAMQCGFDPETMEFESESRITCSVASDTETATLSSGANTTDNSPPEAVEPAGEADNPTPEPLYAMGQSVDIIEDDQLTTGNIVNREYKDEKWVYFVGCDENDAIYEREESEIGEK